ncbi:DNRLRE domain-containing protein [Clostridium felsineum]|uniref:Uncharacterized protein n=1 Tax=Clostridium felsineum TaxID=36839 RepID=A0A1S8KYN3_9CLOT|nr:DNRLRE domain-containing protein [Clostridium felsineum]MCR3760753.1 DNRLRE domain-containing protein [Clostridium felsineum]URZ03888.1 hypothetical protein CLAUR_039540 [Clostridium felsineum]URZ07836.1 hypothetical protein CLROS_031970 [Clostridium felsineum]URZ12867.1 hypothetical protein CROST_036120 [Clostridium felsineum]
MSEFNFTPIGTTFVYSAAPTKNYSTLDTIYVGKAQTGTDFYRGILQFDLSKIPIEASVLAAKLKLYVNYNLNSALKQIKLYQILQSYAINTVTFNTQPIINNNYVSYINLTNEINEVININLTNLASQWHKGEASNFGVVINGEEASQGSVVGFSSINTINSSQWPRLDVEFSNGSSSNRVLTSYGTENYTTADSIMTSNAIPLGVGNGTFAISNVGLNSAQVEIQLSNDQNQWFYDGLSYESNVVLQPGNTTVVTSRGNMAYMRIAYSSYEKGKSTEISISPSVLT